MNPSADEVCEECRELAFTCPCAKQDNDETGQGDES